MKSYAGQYLRINLTDGTIKKEPLPEEWARMYLGGRGIGARILWDETGPETDPLGPDNKLLILGGAFQGTNICGSGRYCVMYKSPLTGLIGEAYSGGAFIHEFKWAGYDFLIIEGKAPKPSYIHIADDLVEIRDAAHLWGLEVREYEEAVRDELGDPGYKCCGIGPAGEKQVLISCIMNDFERAAGRTGGGAVFGSKNLKCIAVRGTKGTTVADPDKLMELSLENRKLIIQTGMSQGLKRGGTGTGIPGLNEAGILPTENFNKGTFEGHMNLAGDTMYDTIMVNKKACTGCAIGCINQVRVQDSPYGDVSPVYGGPEYETAASMGSLLGIDDLNAVAKAAERCNALGLDTIAAGTTMAFATECFINGLLKKEDVGFELDWNRPMEILQLLEMIAKREGIGDLLANGSTKAAEHIEGDQPRGRMGMGLQYATAPRGANHLEGYHDTGWMAGPGSPEMGVEAGVDRFTLKGKAWPAIATENQRSVDNSIVMCCFTVAAAGDIRNLQLIVDMLNACTGWELTYPDLQKIGERSYVLTRAYSCREGVTRADDHLPEKVQKPLDDGGATAGQVWTPEEWEETLDEYYEMRGYDKNGIPTKEKLTELGLADVAEGLYKALRK